MRLPVASVLVMAACGGDAIDPGGLSVYAASSLTEAFTQLEGIFERSYPGVDVAVTFAGSQVLRLQIEQGAQADVFASANLEHMQTLLDSGLVDESAVFAHGDLVVIVPLDNPARIQEFADISHAERIVIGTANVPVGEYTRTVLARASTILEEGFEAMVMSRVVSQETNVRLARAKVELGEADAAIVYRTDAGSSARVSVIEIPRELNEIADYTVGVLTGSPRRAAADAWVSLLLSAEGRSVLARHGFILE